MPQKLIRLTSDTGDGIFNGLFNEEIEIKENSEIALQSLSMERLSSEMILNGDNNDIQFASVGATLDADNDYIPNQAGRIVPFGTIDKSNYLRFLDDISGSMNRVCDAFQANRNDQWGIQHAVSVNPAGKIQVSAHVSPFYQLAVYGEMLLGTRQPGVPSFVRNSAPVTNGMPISETLSIWESYQGGDTGDYGMFRTTAASIPGQPDLNECYAFGVEAVTKSTGVALRTRLKRLLTSTGGDPSFTMGLIKGDAGLDKLRNSSFSVGAGAPDLDYAIRVNGKDTPIQYIAKKGDAFSDSAATPINFTTAAAGQQMNDVLDIRIGSSGVKGVITSQVLSRADPPVVTPLPNMVGYDTNADYYWCIFMHEPLDKCVLDLVGVTLDPVGPGGANLNTSSLDVNAFDQDATTGFSLISNLPVQEEEVDFTPAVSVDEIISSFLGFTPAQDLGGLQGLGSAQVVPTDASGNPSRPYLQQLGYVFTAQNLFDNSYDSDTYIIDTQTFTLDSFDSYGLNETQRNSNSGGSRRNIIATIPVSETSLPGSANSIIQYEPATQNYIKIKNRSDIVTRQIRCRLLTGTYQPVKTQGLASIVLLIKE